MDALLLSRIQFGFVISFHILFPAFSIGLAWWLVFLEACWLKRGGDHWRDLYFFWMKIFAVVVRHGRRLRHRHEFPVRHQLGALFRPLAGNVVGPLLNYEVLTAFFSKPPFFG